MKKLKIGLAGLAVLAGLLMMSNMASAAEFIHPDKDSGNVTLPTGETHHNVYIGGGSVLVNSAITGDLYAAGGTITVEGGVEQDVVIAGGTININSPVGGDVRVVGGTITINAPVSGEIIMAGGTLVLTEKATVAGDLVAGGGEITVNGSVGGAVKINGGMVTLNSAVTGPVQVRTNDAFTIGPKAVVAQNIKFEGPHEATVQDGAKIGAIDFTEVEHHHGAAKTFAAILTLAFILKIIAGFIATVLVLHLLPRTSETVLMHIKNRPWVNLGIGFLGIFLIPIISIIALFLLVGMYIGVIALLAYVLLLLFAGLSGVTFVGAWIVQALTKRQAMHFDWQAVAIGIVVVSIVSLIPFVGPLAIAILIMLTFGSLLRVLNNWIHNQHRAAEINN